MAVDEEVRVRARLCRQPASKGEELRDVRSLWRDHVRVVFIDDIVKAKLKLVMLAETAKRVRHWPVWIKKREDVADSTFAVSVELVDTADADPEG